MARLPAGRRVLGFNVWPVNFGEPRVMRLHVRRVEVLLAQPNRDDGVCHRIRAGDGGCPAVPDSYGVAGATPGSFGAT